MTPTTPITFHKTAVNRGVAMRGKRMVAVLIQNAADDGWRVCFFEADGKHEYMPAPNKDAAKALVIEQGGEGVEMGLRGKP